MGYQLTALLLALSSSRISAAAVAPFGDELLSRGYFRDASLEYQRHLAMGKNGGASDLAALERALHSSLLSKDYQFSAEVAGFYAAKYPKNSRENCIARFFLGASYYNLKGYPRARIEFNEASERCGEPISSQSSYWSGLSSIRLEEYDSADKALNRAALTPEMSSLAKSGLEAAAAIRAHKFKEPYRAGLMSALVPGSGYIYAGYPQTGTLSLLTIGLFTWGTVAAAKDNQAALAIVLGSINFAWYFGGIQGSANATRRTNNAWRDAIILPLEKIN